MKVLEPAEGVLAFYDGREEGATLDGTNWAEYDLVLGTASYAIVAGRAALVYDTHTSPGRGAFVRSELERRGVSELTVVLSHWHLDHIAGAGAFADCPVIATARTRAQLMANREKIESGALYGPPPIRPVVLPTQTFEGRLPLMIGRRRAELIHFDIHSDDAAVVWFPDERLLLAGDTLEDTVTFVDEPAKLETHLAELVRMADLGPDHILPAHGDAGVIEAGGYGPALIGATQAYIEKLMACREDEGLREVSLREFAADALESGTLVYHPPYEVVHRDNVTKVVAK